MHAVTKISSYPPPPSSSFPSLRWARTMSDEQACRFLSIRAVRVEMELTITIGAIHSKSCSYVMDLQSETTGIAVPFSITTTFDECVCACYLYRLATRRWLLYICHGDDNTIFAIHNRQYACDRMSVFTYHTMFGKIHESTYTRSCPPHVHIYNTT